MSWIGNLRRNFIAKHFNVQRMWQLGFILRVHVKIQTGLGGIWAKVHSKLVLHTGISYEVAETREALDSSLARGIYWGRATTENTTGSGKVIRKPLKVWKVFNTFRIRDSTFVEDGPKSRFWGLLWISKFPYQIICKWGKGNHLPKIIKTSAGASRISWLDYEVIIMVPTPKWVKLKLDLISMSDHKIAQIWNCQKLPELGLLRLAK